MAKSTKLAEELDMEPINLPRQRKPPMQLTGMAPAIVATTIQDHYQPMFFTHIDTAILQLSERFTNSVGLNEYRAIEEFLLSGIIDTDLLSQYNEIEVSDLQLQLQHFQRKRPVKSVEEVVAILRKMKPEVRGEYVEVERLVHLFLVSPASSVEAERSFSALHRLKTWLRSTTTQVRLNAIAVCHIHQQLLNNIDDNAIVQAFVAKCEYRALLFGKL